MNLFVVLCLCIGFLFFLGGTVGIIRMPDFYTRLHPAGKLDTLGLFAMVSGLALYNLHHFSFGAVLLSIKMMLIVFFVFHSIPTATHAIVDAGMRAGLSPLTRKKPSQFKGTGEE
ncbi:monovalent cation/H(+) antiporter subunit G [uncultured Desulfobacter sp.]|jgi:multicomponent Na+:H+ antiporter subunit G|uniref:monovalent cation/H(+) antiporter subunit G n=1 Tax=uncultured Desulfobacter sp. TaxID=240139 RepID=UPI0029C7E95F|nr:monovalent cation/H(+) antiporter subunit G [uncultured Desulfobacter sp.]